MLLLIPGPVMTRPEVKDAMAVDLAPWDPEFREFAARLRKRILLLAGGVEGAHSALPLQGCGHFVTEAALRTFLPPGGRILVPMTGAYAERMVRLAREAGRVPVPLPIDQERPIDPAQVAAALEADARITHAGIVYSETGSGVVCDAPAVGRAVRQAGRRMILDAVSAFGALPWSMEEQPETDAVVFTANKCLEGMPGLAFAIAPVERLEACAGNAGSWSLDLADIHANSLRWGPGSSRFTPPAQVMNALGTALDLLEQEGGPAARLARYRDNMRVLYEGVLGLGLTPYLAREAQGPVIVNVRAPAVTGWDLQAFVRALKRRDVLISNFYNTPEPSFRVGCIGAITPQDMAFAVEAIGAALAELGAG
ncbi:MAG TPA: 2-aminoethylphosphonate--pyruvate transaminase [Acetobacteraceae bacterium]|nr:2-aminoethylphosphonate--pyruvate transaminase [Acetobacteraceae bacterium]